MAVARSDACHATADCDRLYRRAAVGTTIIAELAAAIHAPALRATIDDRTGVGITGAYRGDATASRERLRGHKKLKCAIVAKLAVAIDPPALHRAIDNRTRMACPQPIPWWHRCQR